MPQTQQANRPRRPFRAALMCLFGRPCLKQYVLWSLAVALGATLFLSMRELVPAVPKATIHVGGTEAYMHTFLLDDKTLVTSADTGSYPRSGPLHLWDVETGQCRLSFVGPWSGIRKVEAGPGGKVFIVHDEHEHVTMWDSATGKEVANFADKWPTHCGGEFSPDGRFLILKVRQGEWPRKYCLLFWEVETKSVRASFEGYSSDVVIAEDGKQMAFHRRTESSPDQIERWRLDADFPEAGPFQIHEVIEGEVAMSPKLDTFATRRCGAGPDKSDVIQLWDLATGREIATAQHRDPDPINNRLRYSPNARFLTVDNPHRFNQIHRIPQGPPPLWDTKNDLKEVGANFDPIHISADDCWLLAYSQTPGVGLYDSATLQRRGTVSVRGDWTMQMATGQTISPSDADNYNFAPDSKTVLVTGLTARENSNAFTDFVNQYFPAIKPRSAFTSSSLHVVRLWDVETAQEIGTIWDCRDALFSADGKTLATCHPDGTVKVWDVPPRKPVWRTFGLSLALWLFLLVAVRSWLWLIAWWFGRRSQKH